MEFLLDVLL